MNADLTFDKYTQAQFAPPPVSILNAINCATERKAGLLKKVFTKKDKPKTMELELDSTATAPEEEKGFFKRLFKRRTKEEKEERKKKRKEKRGG